jgi:hypothetical protein
MPRKLFLNECKWLEALRAISTSTTWIKGGWVQE